MGRGRLGQVTEHPSPEVAQLMAGIVDNRMRMWSLLQEVVSRPDDLVVERLNSGEWVDDVREAVQWLGDAAERFRPGLDAVKETVAASPATLDGLVAGFDTVSAGQRASLRDVITDLTGQLAAEKRSWASGDDDSAKILRLAQHDQLHKRMVPAIQQWCRIALNQQASPVLSALVKFAVIVLSMETGSDFERAMEGRGFRVTDDIA